MFYEHFNDAAMDQLVRARIAQAEADHFGATLSRDAAQHLGDDDQAAQHEARAEKLASYIDFLRGRL